METGILDWNLPSPHRQTFPLVFVRRSRGRSEPSKTWTPFRPAEGATYQADYDNNLILSPQELNELNRAPAPPVSI